MVTDQMQLKRIAKTALQNKAANWAFRTALKPLLARSGGSVCGYMVPIVGSVPVALPDGEQIVIAADGSDEVASQLWWGGFAAYEPETAQLFRVLAGRSAVILDVGAYTGYFSLLGAHANEEATVFAFEPTPESHAALTRNVALNGAPNIVPQRLAVGDSDAEVSLYLPRDGMPADASTLRGFREAVRDIRVQQVCLDSWSEKMDLERVDLMKLDTEGTEHLVLRGATGVLEAHSPCIVCEVLHGRTESMLEEVLSGLDYRYFHITDTGPKEATSIRGDRSERFRNYLFCPYHRLGTTRAACHVCPARAVLCGLPGFGQQAVVGDGLSVAD
jgi:FkbM family methyltransferase